MRYSDYGEDVQEWIKEVEESRGKNIARMMEYAKKIRLYGETHGIEALVGYGCYYISEAYFLQNDVEHFFENIMVALGHLQYAEEWELAAKACNLLGVVTSNQGNTPFAIDYYLGGISICEEHNAIQVKSILKYNIGMIYMTCQKYYQAIEYLESSAVDSQYMEDEQRYLNFMGIVYLAEVACYIELGNAERAKERMDLVTEQIVATFNDLNCIYFDCVRARFYNLLEEEEKRDSYIAKIDGCLTGDLALMEIFDDFYRYCEMLLEIGKYEELWNAIRFLGALLKSEKLVDMYRRLLDLELRYYQKVGDQENFLRLSGKYYKLSQIREQENRSAMGNMLSMRLTLEEFKKKQSRMEQENRRLQYQSETDSLTEIANRQYLDQIAETIFTRARENGSYFSLEILDVDYFKELNDNYGHSRGDQCLVAIAKELKRLESYGNICCARYGGDEFCLLYEGYGPQEVQGFLKMLREQVKKLGFEHAYSPAGPIVTVSQGVYCGIPTEQDTLSDYFHGADAALYRVKRSGKNNYAIEESDKAKPS